MNRFTLLLVGQLVVLVVAAALLFENRQRNAIIHEVEKRGLVIAQRLADSSTTYLLTYNYVALEQLARQMARDPDIEYAIILDKEGEVAAHSQQSDLLRRIPEDVSAPPMDASQPRLRRYLLPGAAQRPVLDAQVAVAVENSNESWGAVRVGVSLAGMEAEIGRTRGQIVLFGLLAVAFGSLGSALLGRRIVRPTQPLAAGVPAGPDRARGGAGDSEGTGPREGG